MIEKLKNNRLYIKYGIIIIFVAVVLVLTVKAIEHGDAFISFIAYEGKRFLSVISPVIYAVLLSYLLWMPVSYSHGLLSKGINLITKRNANEKYNKLIRFISILIVFFIGIYALVLIFKFLVPPILESITKIINSLPYVQEQIKEWSALIVEGLKNNNIDVKLPSEFSSEIVNMVGAVAQDSLNFFIGTISGISSFLLDFVVILILTIYFLMDKERLICQLKKLRDVLLPKKVGRALSIFLYDLDNIVGRFILGEILDSIIVAVVSTGLLLLIGHPFAVLIGFIAGVTNIIPYIGPVIGAVLAFLFGIFTSIPLGVTGAVLLLLYQQIDGNIIQPKIVGDKIGLSPVWILIAVLIGGSYFGALGMILSIPFAGLLRVYFNRYSEYKKIKES